MANCEVQSNGSVLAPRLNEMRSAGPAPRCDELLDIAEDIASLGFESRLMRSGGSIAPGGATEGAAGGRLDERGAA